MNNTEKEPTFFEKKLLKIKGHSTEIGPKGHGSCIIKIEDKELPEVTIGRLSNGEVWISNTTANKIQEVFGLETIERLKSFAKEKFEQEIKSRHILDKELKEPVNETKSNKVQDKGGAPFCKKCKTYHWPQDGCEPETKKRVITG